jgi:hypothetical protein
MTASSYPPGYVVRSRRDIDDEYGGVIVKKKVNFINSSQNEGLPPSCIALSFD